MKRLLVALTFITLVQSASSQTFLHGAGVGFNYSHPKSGLGDSKVYFTLHYYPQVTFVENESFSVSAGIPLTVGLTGTFNASYSSRGDSYEENTLFTLVQIPLMVNFNGGAGSTKENEQRFGYFLGGGFGYHSTGIGNLFDENGNEMDKKAYAKGFGPAANAGVRFAVGSHQKTIEIRASFMQGLKDYKPGMFGLNAAFNF